MTDHHRDVLASGPGSLPDSISRQGPGDPGPAVDVRFEDDGGEPAQRTSDNRALAVVRGIVSPESLSVTALLLALMPMFGTSLLLRLAGMVAGTSRVTDSSDGPPTGRAEQLFTTYGHLNVGVALLGMVAGLAALVLARADAPRWVRGIGGAAVIAGFLQAAANLAISGDAANPYAGLLS